MGVKTDWTYDTEPLNMIHFFKYGYEALMRGCNLSELAETYESIDQLEKIVCNGE